MNYESFSSNCIFKLFFIMSDSSSVKKQILAITGFNKLNPMQIKMSETDDRQIILLAPTGSGKTIAFTIRLLRFMRRPGSGVQAVILAPSRELALQIAGVLKKVAPSYRVTPLFGGHSFRDEANSLAANTPDIIVATPGRLLDHIGRRNIDLTTISSLVIDEYDKCLELGFMDEMKRILHKLKNTRLTILTSATAIDCLPESMSLDKAVTFDFREDTSGSASATPDIEIIEVPSPLPDKIGTLIDLLRAMPADTRSIVFTNHRESAERIHQELRKAGLPAGIYHGGMEQQDRQLAVTLLRNGTTPILSATDLAARGLDIPQIEAVIHYHVPTSPEAWTHRNGRTARAGASGKIYTILSDKDDRPELMDADRIWSPPHSGSSTSSSQLPVTLLINLGKRDKISRGDILGFLTKQAGLNGADVGRIDVEDRFSTVVLTPESAELLLKSTQPQKIKGHRFRPEFLS